ncbi:MAG: large subunit ribosomal protein L19e [Archaeoglobi archaeon]|nr:50S ribosomal protein L19e [Candidatus Mnemosynella bozhongmuii]MDI3502602.1 large subunit ribosomal protein L19e [Archaeoglobi archaeon]MDK2781003.1 large subunit ribosomal protein L19e [Archaeoglobi archaeon]
MVNLTTQRRLAADILKVGLDRVWFDPEALDEIATAITRDDIRALIEEGKIKRKPKKGISRARARKRLLKRMKGRGRGPGSRKGAKGARDPKKRQWIRKIRALRSYLRELRDQGKITRSTYRMLYRKASGGEFRSVSHLQAYIKSYNLMVEENHG